MTRPKTRRTLRLERLESRMVLSGGGPSADQQYMLELLNQARTDPSAWADRITSNLDANVTATVKYYHIDLQAVKAAIVSTPARVQPPLAWNATLAGTAAGQSQDEAANGFQGHTGSNGSSYQSRLDSAGYTNRASDGENTYAYAASVDEAMQAFGIDWGVAGSGHRENILQPNVAPSDAYREVGIGLASSSKVGPLVATQDFGSRQGAQAELLGVVYDDPGHTHLYAEGSGRGDVTIQAVNERTGDLATVQTWDQGGYQIPLAPGTYKVAAIVGGQVVRSQDVTIGDQNVKVDYDLSDPWAGGLSPVDQFKKAVTPPPAPAVVTPSPITEPDPTRVAANTTEVVANGWVKSFTSWNYN